MAYVSGSGSNPVADTSNPKPSKRLCRPSLIELIIGDALINHWLSRARLPPLPLLQRHQRTALRCNLARVEAPGVLDMLVELVGVEDHPLLPSPLV
eukprot:5097004-Prymnesium_polylepis.1